MEWIRIGDDLINTDNVNHVSISKNENGEYNSLTIFFIHGDRLQLRGDNSELLDKYVKLSNRVS